MGLLVKSIIAYPSQQVVITRAMELRRFLGYKPNPRVESNPIQWSNSSAAWKSFPQSLQLEGFQRLPSGRQFGSCCSSHLRKSSHSLNLDIVLGYCYCFARGEPFNCVVNLNQYQITYFELSIRPYVQSEYLLMFGLSIYTCSI